MKLTEEDWSYLDAKFPGKKDLFHAIISEIERLQRKKPEPITQKMLTRDYIIPEEYDEYLIKIATAEGTTVSQFIKKEIIFPSL